LKYYLISKKGLVSKLINMLCQLTSSRSIFKINYSFWSIMITILNLSKKNRRRLRPQGSFAEEKPNAIVKLQAWLRK